jgi:enoyl-CoA hydratase/carnithine racemase
MSDAETLVLYEVDNGVATLTLNRPKRLNAWTPEMEEVWNGLLDRAVTDDEVRAVVVTGSGRGFCSGMDSTVLAQRSVEGSPPKRTRQLSSLADLPKPVIGAINGAAVGLGFALALCCDVRFGTEATALTSGFATRGLVAESATPWLLPRLVGHARAMDLLLTGRTCQGEEALQIGLLNWLVLPGDLVTTAQDYAASLAIRSSPLSMAVMKDQLSHDWNRTRFESEDLAADLWREPRYRRDMPEGVTAHRERRAPVFPPLGTWPPPPIG